MTEIDIKNLVMQFKAERNAEHRYASFDYCFNYFRKFKEEGRLAELRSGNNMEMSCLHIGFFLASWGMFRMSGELGKKVNARHFCKLIDEISKWENEHPFSKIWDIDAQDYDDAKTRKLLLDCFVEIEKVIVPPGQKASRTLVTKVMLGIFGCVPAFDGYFTKTFAFTQFNADALLKLAAFHQSHLATIRGLAAATKTFDFKTGKATGRAYTKAKIIDMIGFQEGKNKADAKKAKEKAAKEAVKRLIETSF